LHVFTIKNMTETLTINIVCNAIVHYPHYARSFFEFLSQKVKTTMESAM
jgi:hypothetical protein